MFCCISRDLLSWCMSSVHFCERFLLCIREIFTRITSWGSFAEISELTKAGILGLALSSTQPEATQIRQQMEAYLNYYDVESNFLTARGFTVANILENAEANDCDLIALSASHHGRLYELVFQSTTQTVVKLADRAVLVTK